MVSARTLAYRYVNKRRARGEITDDSARVLAQRIVSFVDFTDRPVDRWKRKHVERWMELPSISPTTKRARLSALRGFCQWCVVEGHLAKDPTLGVVSPPVEEGLKRARRPDEVAAILARCPDLRAKACVLLMVQEGLRRGEVAAAEVVDLCLRTRTLAVKGKGGRGRLTRVVPVSEETMNVLLAYFAEIGMSAGPLIRSTTEPGTGLTPTRIYQIVIAAMYAAGVKLGPHDGCSPHALRHTTAHDMLDAGADILEVQQMLGHRSVDTTQRTYGRGWVAPNLRAAAGGRTYLG